MISIEAIQSKSQTTSARNKISGLLLGVSLAVGLTNAYAAGSNANYASTPPTLTVSSEAPNVLVILDNSNSMDEAPDGHAVGSANPGSKSEIARVAVKNIISNYTNKINMGLMAYQQSGVSTRNLHDSWYDLSYKSSNYDSNYDLTVSGARDSDTKKFYTVSTSTSGVNRDIYYNVALPFYAGSNQGTAYCYSRTADFDNGSENSSSGPWDTYHCFREKTNTSDAIPSSDGDNSSAGYNSKFGSFSLSPTDSDLAQNILDFGARLGWQYVSKAWFSNSSPGRGYLHTPIAKLDSTQVALLNAKLATSQFSSSIDTPLRNAGLTPLEGTLDSALSYYNGTALPSNEGGETFTPASCGSDNYVILVTDGLPSTDPSGNNYVDTNAAITAVSAKAAALYSAGVQVYVVGFALPASVDPTTLDTIANAGGTGTAYSASDSATLDATLSNIFKEVFNNTYSGSAAAVVTNTGKGTGAVYQALYNPSLSNGTTAIKWTGQLYSLFIDNNSYLREDTNGDNKLSDSYTDDKIVEIVFRDAPGGPTRLMVERYSVDADGKQLTTPDEVVEFSELGSIWNASDVLGSLDQGTIANQRTYSSPVGTSANAGRHVLSRINGTNVEFIWNSNSSASTADIDSTNFRYLGVTSESEAENIVKFIRGQEGISGYRSRTLDGERFLLGDIIHSNPVVVGVPDDGYDLDYNDSSYANFRQKHFNRRHMVYVGGNDGMIHAFNAGFWNAGNKSYDVNKPGGGAETAHPLGAEIWSYIPENLLPHLQWLKDPNYQHMYYMDGDPLVFDAKIFTPDTTKYIGGWGTLLAIGMRLGGGAMTVDTDGTGGDDWTTKSSYILLDITDPESPPIFFAEISDTNLGFTTAKPVVAKDISVKTDDSGTTVSKNDWYLVFGSGPGPNDSPANAQSAIASFVSTQDSRIYKYDLSTKSFASGFAGGKSTGHALSFVGGLATADWDKDATDDAVYFGTVGPIGTAASDGSVYRLRLSDDSLPRLYDAGKPVSSIPLVTTDNNGDNWVHVGTGRLYSTSDNSNSDQQVYLGLREPEVSNELTYADIASSSPSTLLNISGVRVFDDGTIIDTLSNVPSSVTTVNALESYIESSTSGWYLNLQKNSTNPSGRNLIETDRINTSLLFTEYKPSDNACNPKGSSRIYRANLKTGVGEVDVNFGVSTATVTLDDGTTVEKNEVVNYLDAGDGNITGGNIHQSEGGGANLLLDKDDGSKKKIKLTTKTLTSGRQSWREISN